MVDHKGFDYRDRCSLRKKDFNYAGGGYYFVNFCVQDRRCLLGDVVDGKVQLTIGGKIVGGVIDSLPTRYPGLILDSWVIMPNHVHLILGVPEPNFSDGAAIHPGQVVRAIKAAASRLIHQAGFGEFRWQSDYWDRIIRNDRELTAVRQYIEDNLAQWELDADNPDRHQELKTR
jgi:putative transposase